MSNDHQHEIAIATKINEQLCKEVEAKGELVALFSKKFDDQCNDNIMLARDKLSTGKVIKGLIRDQQSRDQLVDHLQIQLEEGRTKKATAIEKRDSNIKQLTKEVEIKRELVTDVASKMKKLKVCNVEFTIFLHSMDTV